MLDISPWLMLFVLALFLILLVILNQLLYRPLLKFMDDRENSIAKDLESAKSLSNNSEALHNEAEEILNNAKAEATAIRENAISEAKVVAQKSTAQKQTELNTEYETFLEKLGLEKETLRNALLSQMPLIKESLKAKFAKL
jgi:F-type H+-transporting ATPase subunit b